MGQPKHKLGIVRSYLVPSLVIFLLPTFSLGFFTHAQSRFDQDVRRSVQRDIRDDRRLTRAEKQQALAFFDENLASRILVSSDPALATLQENFDPETKFHFATFRWMIRLSLFCLTAGIVVFAVAGLSVLLSMRSQRSQYLSLAIGWHVLRMFCTLQVLAQACLLVALSFWMTALWFDFYSIRIVVICGLIAAGSTLPVLSAIFRKVDDHFEVSGEVLTRDSAIELYDDLDQLCTKVGTEPPDQVVAGIDDNFFVTEHPVTVNGKAYTGRTLYVSLSLLKKLQGREADAVFAHELAHFSGNDTLFSRKIGPLLVRYQHYLEGLSEGVLARPVFYCAAFFRALYEVSIKKWSRAREFRADRIAAETTSPNEVAQALLRIAAYSGYRQTVEGELLSAEHVHEKAGIVQRVEDGFQQFAVGFAGKHDVRNLPTSHPFDSHPPLGQRLKALGFESNPTSIQEVLLNTGEGTWFHRIANADELEQSLWQQYEEMFLKFHENVLAFRYLPATDDEREIVEKYFPAIELMGPHEKRVAFDFEQVAHEDWKHAVYYRDVRTAGIDWDKLRLELVVLKEGGVETLFIPLGREEQARQRLIEAFQNYFGRHQAAVEYQEQSAQADSEDASVAMPHANVDEAREATPNEDEAGRPGRQAPQRLATSPSVASASLASDQADLVESRQREEPCPWCDLLVVRTAEDRCPECARPI